jgi:serine/threonine protein kinase
MQERIGKGAFGAVYKAIDKRTQQPVAVKVCCLAQTVARIH